MIVTLVWHILIQFALVYAVYADAGVEHMIVTVAVMLSGFCLAEW